jgi:hypothetical protein
MTFVVSIIKLYSLSQQYDYQITELESNLKAKESKSQRFL